MPLPPLPMGSNFLIKSLFNRTASLSRFLLNLANNPIWIATSSIDALVLVKSLGHHISSQCRFLAYHINPFWIHLCYFISISVVGALILKALPMRVVEERPSGLDMLFMSISAVTVSSMGVVEMEAFSNSQLVAMALLMLIGGEVFLSMFELEFCRKKETLTSGTSIELTTKVADQIESGVADQIGSGEATPRNEGYECTTCLGYVVLGYLVLTHVGGATSIFVYVSAFPTVLGKKGINSMTFSFFVAVSSFTNCGFVPTNENMIVFKECSGLLMIVAALVLSGNTMYPPLLQLGLWVLKKVTKRREFDVLMKDQGELGYDHLLPRRRSVLLVATVAGFVVVQLVLFCSMEWRSEGLEGMSPLRKMVAALFMSINSRHAGESVVDLSAISSAILVLYVVMMFLPPYTSFNPMYCDGSHGEVGQKREGFLKNLVLSQLSYLVIFVIIICITERGQISEDPVNFSVLNIVFEVISAYGNVGYSVGYSCKRQLKPQMHCQDKWYGFAGRWSNEGKVALMAVMLFGRLKKFSMESGRAWTFS